MTVITISRGSKSMGTAVAEQVAERLGYQCISRAVLLEASEQYDIPEIKLAKAMRDAPFLLGRLGHRKQSYVARVQSALVKHLAQDNVVYHGVAGHVLVKNVAHVLKVRIVANLEDRVAVVMREEGLSEVDAQHLIEKVDKGRRRWSHALYDIDPTDASLYDLVLKVPRFGVEEAADVICRGASLRQFATSQDSRRDMSDLVLACEVKAKLVDDFPEVMVASKGGNVLVYCKEGERHGRKVRSRAEPLMDTVEGINNLEVHVGAAPPKTAI